LPGSYPGDAGSIPAPATNSRQAGAAVVMGLLIAVFLFGLAFGVCLLPGLFLLLNLRDEQEDNAQCFEEAFGPAGEK
jgi:hypothetical protein